MYQLFVVGLLIATGGGVMTNAGQLHRIENSIKVIDYKLSAISIEVSTLKNGVADTNKKLDLILEIINGAATGRHTDQTMAPTSDNINESRGLAVPTEIEDRIQDEISRVRRAFVSEKIKLSKQQRKNNDQFREFANKLNDTITLLHDRHETKWTLAADSINVSVTTVLSNVRDDIDMHLLSWNKSVHNNIVENTKQVIHNSEKLDRSILSWNDSVHKSLSEVGQKTASYINTSLIQNDKLTNDVQNKLLSAINILDNTVSTMDYKGNLVRIENAIQSHDDKLTCLQNPKERVRLVGGSTTEQGRLEVKSCLTGVWGTVCDDQFDVNNNAATVVCRNLLSLSKGAAKNGAFFGEGTGPILMDNVICEGNEKSIFDCQFTTNHNCGHGEDVGVICSG